jgi:hypothetical protein
VIDIAPQDVAKVYGLEVRQLTKRVRDRTRRIDLTGTAQSNPLQLNKSRPAISHDRDQQPHSATSSHPKMFSNIIQYVLEHIRPPIFHPTAREQSSGSYFRNNGAGALENTFAGFREFAEGISCEKQFIPFFQSGRIS